MLSILPKDFLLPSKAGRLLSMTAMLLCGAASPAFGQSGQTILFNFNSVPEAYVNPSYQQPQFTVSGLTLKHIPGTSYSEEGTAKWVGNANSINPGYVWLHHCDAYNSTPCSAKATFSTPVASFKLRMASINSAGTITPIPQTGTASPVSVPNTGGAFTAEFEFTNGPYTGFRVGSTHSEKLKWDDLEVTLPSESSVRNVPVAAGDNQPVIDIDGFKATASQVGTGGEPRMQTSVSHRISGKQC